MRLRIKVTVTHCLRRALALADTPRPYCPDCNGEGWQTDAYGDHDSSVWDPCPCWNPNRRWTLIPLPRTPRLLRRWHTPTDPWGSGPPF